MLEHEIFVLEHISIYAETAGSISIFKVSALAHEVFNDTMKHGTFVSHWLVVHAEVSHFHTHRHSPVQSCLKFSAVLLWGYTSGTYLGTTSLYNSNLMRPTGVSPIEMSKKTIGRPFVPAPVMALVMLIVVWRRNLTHFDFAYLPTLVTHMFRRLNSLAIRAPASVLRRHHFPAVYASCSRTLTTSGAIFNKVPRSYSYVMLKLTPGIRMQAHRW